MHAGPVVLIALAACLEPRVSDELGATGQVLPAGSVVPSLYDDSMLRAQVEENDGVGELVPLLAGFVAGGPAAYWDFGPAPDFTAPLFVLKRRNAQGELEAVDHLPIAGRIPGDAGYSPYWRVFVVEVTSAYAGEVIPSVEALDEAQRLGLVGPPSPGDPVNLDCPVVGPDVRLEVGGGNEPAAPAGRFYYRGRIGNYFLFAPAVLPGDAPVPAGDLYVLRREGGEPLRERERGVDMTNDGDLRDSNDIFSIAIGAEGYTPLCRVVEVVVPSGTSSIDTFLDQTQAAFRSATDLFVDGPVAGNVVAYRIIDTRVNCPQQSQAGGL